MKPNQTKPNQTKPNHIYLIFIYKEDVPLNNIRGAYDKFPDFFHMGI